MMVLCSPLLSLHTTRIRAFGTTVCLIHSNSALRPSSSSNKTWHDRTSTPVGKVVVGSSCSTRFQLRRANLWPSDLAAQKSPDAGPKLRTRTVALVRMVTPPPPTAVGNNAGIASTCVDEGEQTAKQQQDRQVVNNCAVSSPKSGKFSGLSLEDLKLEDNSKSSRVVQPDERTRTSAAPTMPRSSRVAVIGAGAAGLVAARELVREGHKVVVLEQEEQVGGVWQYDPRVESDPLGTDPRRSRVHSSVYESLRTNLPREVMGYLDYPFAPKEEEGRDERRFPTHREVARYLEDFSSDFDIRGLVKFGVRVDSARPEAAGTRWVVKFQKAAREETEVFDAVVVCNGHYAEPRIVHISGIESWPGQQTHSHNYRIPHPFQNKVVVVIGSGNSAQDITREIALVAKEVHQCARAWTSTMHPIEGQGLPQNIWQHPMVKSAFPDGTLEFQDGTTTVADVILYCTGYLFSFPFLDITVEDNRVGPLYKHVFPPALAPSLSFVGLPWKVIPFPLMELQSRWIARLLSGKSSLPTVSAMNSDIRTLYEQLNAMNFPKSYTHNCAPYQFEYVDWLAEQSGHKPVETWRKEIYMYTTKNKQMNPATYRDVWEDQQWLEVADMQKVKVPLRGLSRESANFS